MDKITRRTLFKTSAAIAAGLSALDDVRAEDAVLRRKMPMRRLGRTGARVSIIGFGSAPLGHSFQDQATFDRVVGEAIDLGVNYIDTATIYDVAQERLGSIIRPHRSKLFITTKTRGMTRNAAMDTVAESLRLLQTDHVDLVHLHNIGDFDIDRLLESDSPLRGLEEARRKGWLRFIGVSGHNYVEKMVAAVRTGIPDVVMPAVNFVDQHIYGYETRVLPEARKRRMGIVAMKVLGGAPNFAYRNPIPALMPKDHINDSIRYALGLEGVATAVIGFNFVEQLRQAVSVAKGYRPLTSTEYAGLSQRGKELVASWGHHLGPV
ncbi:MAG: aldo/keto reductase [Chthonomonadales bacterium]|nr:aldo/keto reductase [Chthonomonadales bacterium]